MHCPLCDAINSHDAVTCSSCAAPLPRADNIAERLASGTSLQQGAFRIDSVLGQGGFGITYLATDTRLGRAVALKEFFPAACYRDGIAVAPGGTMAPADFQASKQRFLEESRTLARFRHPGIVNVFTTFEENNTAYMVMEFLLGQNLGALVQQRGGALDETEAIDFIRAAGEALDTVHQAGLLHRDIKPENLMLCHDGRIVLIDFGTARDFAAGHTQGHTVVVTPGYAPLEQYAQRAQRGAYSDIYALGATLYFLLTGETPVAATDRIAGIDLEEPGQKKPWISPQVSAAVRWAMALKVDQRPQTVRAFLDALLATTPHLPPTDAANEHSLEMQVADKSMNLAKRLAALPDVRQDSRVLPAAVGTKANETLWLCAWQDVDTPGPAWPNCCACCGETAEVERKIAGKNCSLPGFYKVPYCSQCDSHLPPDCLISESDQSTVFTLGAGALYIGFNFPYVLMLASGGLAVWYCLDKAVKHYRRSPSMKENCANYGHAVTCTQIKVVHEGKLYTIAFTSMEFKRQFEELNKV